MLNLSRNFFLSGPLQLVTAHTYLVSLPLSVVLLNFCYCCFSFSLAASLVFSMADFSKQETRGMKNRVSGSVLSTVYDLGLLGEDTWLHVFKQV